MIQLVTYNLWLAVLLVSFVAASGCFITNCPPGGKRSGAETAPRQCERCGPPGLSGRCFGPQICCSPEFGCFFSTAETYPCQMENRFPTPCHNPGASCSGNGESGLINGQCGTEGICCSSETCTLDDTCHDEAASLPFSLPFFTPVVHNEESASSFASPSANDENSRSRGSSSRFNIRKHENHPPAVSFDTLPSHYPSSLQIAFHKILHGNNGHSHKSLAPSPPSSLNENFNTNSDY